jgi:hypothetical protein
MSSLVDSAEDFISDNKFVVRRMTAVDAVHALEWLEDRGIEFNIMLLPAKGLSCFCGRRLVAVADIYIAQEMGVAFCCLVAADPQNTPAQSSRAVRLLLEMMPEYVKEYGVRFLMTNFSQNSVNRIARRCGYVPGGKSEMFFKRIK